MDDQQVRVGGEKRHELFRLRVTETARRETRQDENERCLGAQSEAVEGRASVFESLGSADDLLSAATAEKMRAELPGLKLVTVARVGHPPMLAEPEAQAAIAELLAEVA